MHSNSWVLKMFYLEAAEPHVTPSGKIWYYRPSVVFGLISNQFEILCICPSLLSNNTRVARSVFLVLLIAAFTNTVCQNLGT